MEAIAIITAITRNTIKPEYVPARFALEIKAIIFRPVKGIALIWIRNLQNVLKTCVCGGWGWRSGRHLPVHCFTKNGN